MPLTLWHEETSDFGSFRKSIGEEITKTIHYLLMISETEELLEEEPLTKASIKMREDLIIPIALIQQYSIQLLNKKPPKKDGTEEDEEAKILKKLIIKSMAACVNASRNSV